MEPIPMTENHPALEPSFADAILAISAATDLPQQTRRHWCSSLTGIAKAFDQPPELIPARYSAVRARMVALHHMPLGWTAKTLANHKSNAKTALIWFAKEKEGIPEPCQLAFDVRAIILTGTRTDSAAGPASHQLLQREGANSSPRPGWL
jgi:hypothetical protein